ncbi:MAG: CapA family protein [Sandaracinaceae bacterium]|nr:CapA family protein [Sandaracinaceae bacterium]
MTLALGGDVIFDAPIEYVVRTRGAHDDDPRAYDELFADLAPRLTSADLAIVNLETPVGTRVRERSEARDYPTFAAPPAFLASLAAAGVDVVTVANNHAYDQGVGGLARTLAHAREARITPTGTTDGAGFSVVAVRGLRIAIVSLTQGTNHRVAQDEPTSPRVHLFDTERLTTLVREARAASDVVIVALHFTDTGEHMPTHGMRVWGRRAAEAGADLVVGHGPHVPSELEIVEVGARRVPFFSSLGNLVAAMHADEHAERTREVHVRDAVLAMLRVHVDHGVVHVDPPELATFWIDDARSASHAVPFTRPVAIDASSRDALGARARRLASLFRTTPAAVSPPHEPITLASAGAAALPPTSRVPAPPSPAAPAAIPAPARDASRAPTPPSPAAEPLGVTFRCGSATESSVDDAALRAWAARRRARPSIHLEVVSTRCEGEPPSLAERRARRAAGLLAVLGPSRSRFTWRAGPVAPSPPSVTGEPR